MIAFSLGKDTQMPSECVSTLVFFIRIITYMYWNNPITKVNWPSSEDPVCQSLHGGTHCLFYDPATAIHSIQPQQTLVQLCDLANQRLQQTPRAEFFNDSLCHDWIANIVKINLMVASLQQFGCVKPMLLIYQDALPFVPATGDSRLKALTCVPEIQTVPTVVTTHISQAEKFKHLQSINCFADLAQICGVAPGTAFLFRLTDPTANYGLDWYEYEHNVGVPSIDWCLQVLKHYLDQQSSSFEFSADWFKKSIKWQ